MASVRSAKKNTKYKESYRRYSCRFCSKSFADSSFRNYHESLHTSTGTTYNCDQCAYTSTNKKYLARHKKVHKPGSNFVCTVCDKGFRTRDHLNKHIRVHTGEKPYKCEECGKAFSARHSWKSHMYIHSDEKPYNCSYCSYACRDHSTLRKHENIHAGIKKTYECGVCHKTYKKTSTLRIHMNETHFGLNVRHHTCDHCAKAFKTRATLRNHIQEVHDRALRCECPICGRQLKSKHNLDAHMKRHIDIRPYSCPYPGCKKAFITQHDAARHIITHYPSRQFVCDLCGRRYSRRWRLHSHLATHEDTVECYHCGQCYHSKIYLARHIRRKHDVFRRALVECDLCGLTVYSKTALVDHIKTGHAGEDKFCKLCNTVVSGEEYLKHLKVSHNISHEFTMKRNCEKREKRLEGESKRKQEEIEMEIDSGKFEDESKYGMDSNTNTLDIESNLDVSIEVSGDLAANLHEMDVNGDIEQAFEGLMFNMKRSDSMDEDIGQELDDNLKLDSGELDDVDVKVDFVNAYDPMVIKVEKKLDLKQELGVFENVSNDASEDKEGFVDNGVDIELTPHATDKAKDGNLDDSSNTDLNTIAQDSKSAEAKSNISILKPVRPRDPNKIRLKTVKNTVRFAKRPVKSLPNPELDLALDMAFESVTNLVPERDDSVLEDPVPIPDVQLPVITAPVVDEPEVEFKPRRRASEPRKRAARALKAKHVPETQATEPPEDSEIIEIPMKSSILEPVTDRMRDPDSSDTVIEYSQGVLSEDISLSIALRDGREGGEPEHAIDKLFIDHAMEEPVNSAGRPRKSSRSTASERFTKFAVRLERALSLNEGTVSKRSCTPPSEDNRHISTRRRSTHVKNEGINSVYNAKGAAKDCEKTSRKVIRSDKVSSLKEVSDNESSARSDGSRGRNSTRMSGKTNEKLSRDRNSEKVNSDTRSINGGDNKEYLKSSKVSSVITSNKVSRGTANYEISSEKRNENVARTMDKVSSDTSKSNGGSKKEYLKSSKVPPVITSNKLSQGSTNNETSSGKSNVNVSKTVDKVSSDTSSSNGGSKKEYVKSSKVPPVITSDKVSQGSTYNKTSSGKRNENVSKTVDKVSADNSSSNGESKKEYLKSSKVPPVMTSDKVSQGSTHDKTSSGKSNENVSRNKTFGTVTPVRTGLRLSRDRISCKVSSDRTNNDVTPPNRTTDNVPCKKTNDTVSQDETNEVPPKNANNKLSQVRTDQVSPGSANNKLSQVRTDEVSPESANDKVSQVNSEDKGSQDATSEKVSNSETTSEYSQRVLREDIARSVCKVAGTPGAEGTLDYLFIRHVMGPGAEKPPAKEHNELKADVCADKVKRVNKIMKKMKREVRARKEMAILDKARQQYNARIRAAMAASKKKDHINIKYFKSKSSKDNDATNTNDVNNDKVTDDNDVTPNDKGDDRVADNDNGGDANDDGTENDEAIEDGRKRGARKITFNTHQCYICFKLFKTKLELTEHCKDHFTICNDVMLKRCPYCGHVTDRALGPHLRDKHGVVLRIDYANIFEDHNYLGSKIDVRIAKNCVLEIIPSVKNLNRQASMKIDAHKRDVTSKQVASRKLVRREREWIVETEAVKVGAEYLLPEFNIEELKELKPAGDSYEDNLKKLGALAKKRGLKMLYPCRGCEKICRNLSALVLHNRKHQKNPKPFKPKVWKARQVKTKAKVKVNLNNGKNDRLKDNRYAKPKPVANKHKCDEELIRFYENNIRGSDIEFWQFLKIYNRMTRENVNDFGDLEARTDNVFGIHFRDSKYNRDSELNNPETSDAIDRDNADGATARKRRKVNRKGVKGPTLLSKQERDRRDTIKMEMRKKIESGKK